MGKVNVFVGEVSAFVGRVIVSVGKVLKSKGLGFIGSRVEGLQFRVLGPGPRVQEFRV